MSLHCVRAKVSGLTLDQEQINLHHFGSEMNQPTLH